jgi:hypothetical protein
MLSIAVFRDLTAELWIVRPFPCKRLPADKVAGKCRTTDLRSRADALRQLSRLSEFRL